LLELSKKWIAITPAPVVCKNFQRVWNEKVMIFHGKKNKVTSE